jgi:hypothetical protein
LSSKKYLQKAWKFFIIALIESLMILTLIFIQRFNKSNNKELPGLLKIFFGGQEPVSLGKPIEKK